MHKSKVYPSLSGLDDVVVDGGVQEVTSGMTTFGLGTNGFIGYRRDSGVLKRTVSGPILATNGPSADLLQKRPRPLGVTGDDTAAEGSTPGSNLRRSGSVPLVVLRRC
jgi:hypothetical protein